MDLKTWKRANSDHEIIVEVPYQKVIDVFRLLKARAIGTYYDKKTESAGVWLVVRDEPHLAEVVAVLKDMKAKGIDIESELWNGAW